MVLKISKGQTMSKIIKNEGFEISKAGGWTGIANDVFRTPKLTPTAKTLFFLIASMDKEYDFSFSIFKDQLGVSPATYNKAMKELEAACLVERVQRFGHQWTAVIFPAGHEAWVEWRDSEGQSSTKVLVKSCTIIKEHSKKNPPPKRTRETEPSLQAKHERVTELLTPGQKALPLETKPNRNQPAIPEDQRPTLQQAISEDLGPEQFVIEQFAFHGHKISIASAAMIAMRWKGAGRTRNDLADKIASLHADPDTRYNTKTVSKILLQDAFDIPPPKTKSPNQPATKSYRPPVDPGPGYENKLRPENYVHLAPEPQKVFAEEELRLIEEVRLDSSKMPELIAYYERKALNG